MSYVGQQTELVEFTRDEIGALLASLNFTRNRTLGKSWEQLDENLIRKLKEIQSMFGMRYA